MPICLISGGEGLEAVTLHNAAAFGRMLWLENAKSLDARYADARSSGMYDPAEIQAYQLARFIQIKPEAAIGCANCLDYQSCEHSGWRDSLAYDLVRTIIATAVRSTFPNAPWGFRDDEAARAYAQPVDRFNRAGRPESPVLLSTLATRAAPAPAAPAAPSNVVTLRPAADRPETLHGAAPAFPAPAPKAKPAKAEPAPKAEPIVKDRREFDALRARMAERFAAQRLPKQPRR